MNPNLLIVIVIGVLVGTGVMLLLERTLTRVILGLALMGNGANLLILHAGVPGGPPIVGVTAESQMSDPLSQAMILTAIVITLGMTAFLLAMAYRSWVLTGHDEVQDDVEDRRIRQRAEQDMGPEDQDSAAEETELTLQGATGPGEGTSQ